VEQKRRCKKTTRCRASNAERSCTLFTSGCKTPRQTSIESARGLCIPLDRGDLRADVWVVLGRMPPFDRTVGICLIDHSASETAQKLGVSRATVFRSIKRLRATFAAAGFASGGRRQEKAQ